jgi:membrane protease YdiL (CAAX protease family)
MIALMFMILAIQVASTSEFIFLLSLLELCYLVPSILVARRRSIPLREYVKTVVFRGMHVREICTRAILAISLAILLFFLVPYFITGLALFIKVALGATALQTAQQNLNSFTVVAPGPLDAMFFALTSVVVGVCEEFFYRDFLFQVSKLSKRKNVLISAALFSIYHIITTFNVYSFLYLVAYYFVWGVILAIEKIKLRNALIFPIITHALFDFLTYLA